MPSLSSDSTVSPGTYDRAFYEEHTAGSEQSARVIIPLILQRHSVRSVVDIGCGVGDWLSVFVSHGITDMQGVDGEYVDQRMLRIPRANFLAADLAHPLQLDRRFDLATCLEVAEHLPSASAKGLVQTLTDLADVVLFSAAAPRQGGVNHINEQWPAYWADLFQNHCYTAIDCLRPILWDNSRVEWWYAQNVILYASESAISRNPSLVDGQPREPHVPLSLIHPRSFEAVRDAFEGLVDHRNPGSFRWCAQATFASIVAAMKRRFR